MPRLALAALLLLSTACASERARLLATKSGTAESGAAVYKAHCMGCHGEDLKTGKVGVDVRAEFNPPEHGIHAVLNGERGMPAFADKLSDEEIANLTAYIRGG